MPAILCVHLPDQPAMLRVLRPEAGDTSLGRSDDNLLVIAHASVSRRHACLRHDGERWAIEDLGSTNGVRIGGRPVRHQVLRHGDWFSLGDVFCEFRIADDAALEALSRREQRQRQASGVWLGRLQQAPDRDALLSGLTAAIVQLAECRRGILLAGDFERGFSAVACIGLPPDAPGQQTFAGSTGAIARALHTRAPVLVSDPSALDWARGRQSIVAGGLRALVAVPILQQDRLLGAVYADSNAPGKVFTELDHEILAAFVEQAGLILAARGLDELLARIESCVESDSAGMPVERMAAPHWDRLA